MRDINNVIVLKSTARLDTDKALELYNDHDGDLPEDCFLTTIYEENDDSYEEEEKQCPKDDTWNDADAKFCKECGNALAKPDAGGELGFNLMWAGEDSGASWQNIFVKKVVPHITGRIEALLLLETDDDQPYKLMGVIVEDGTYRSYDAAVQFNPWPNRSSQEDDS